MTAAALLAGTAGAQVQVNLPATAPTAMPAPIAATAPAGAIATHPRRATVTYAAGLLDVHANDSSLNSILREISRLTGMTISGGVVDQRVFGNYGPAAPGVVLATLLDGTGTNLLLEEGESGSPAELILTPRAGGVTPPSPNSVPDNDEEEANTVPAAQAQSVPVFSARPQAQVGYSNVPPLATQTAPPLPTIRGVSGPVPGVQPTNNVLGNPNAVTPTASTLPVTNSVPVDAVGTPSTATPVSGIVDSVSPPTTGSTTAGFAAAAAASAASPVTPTNDADTSGSTLPGGSTKTTVSGAAPNGVRTPQQIFEQLQQIQRATQAQGASQSGTVAPPATTTTSQPQAASPQR